MRRTPISLRRQRRQPDDLPFPYLWAPLGFLIFLLFWEVAARTLVDNPLALVPPSKVIDRATESVPTAEMWNDVRTSLSEYGWGMLIAIIGGLGLGTVIGSSRYLRRMFEPLITALYSTPSLALAPLFVVSFGIGQSSKVGIIAFVAVLPILMSSITGVSSIDPTYLEVAKVYRTGRARKFSSVTMPAAMTTIVNGLRIGAGRGVLGIVLGEFFGSSAGLGYRILIAAQSFDVAELLVAVVMLSLIGVLTSSVFLIIERRLS